jgi:hypothetical protein
MALNQQFYRFGIDELAENTHGWLAAQDTPITRSATDASTFLLRILIQASGGVAHSNQTVTWQYQKNGGGYTNLTTTSSNVKAVTTSVFTNDGNPTSRLTGGTGTFESSSSTLTHDGVTGGANNDIVSNGYCETEIALQLVPADLVQGDVLEFRVTTTTAITTYVATPMLVVTGVGAYRQNTVNFDGTNDYLTRGAALSGIVDSKLGSGSLWFRRTGGTGVLQRLFTSPTSPKFTVHFDTDNKIWIFGRNAAATVILTVSSNTAITDTAWHHVAWSFDLANTLNRQLYLDGVSDLAVTTYTNDTLDIDSPTNWAVGADPAAGNKLSSDLADVWIVFGTYIDLSQTSNLQKFRTLSGYPADLGAFGETPTGTIPLVFLSGPTGSWQTNRGSGGGFTVNGALTDGATFPKGFLFQPRSPAMTALLMQ